MRILIAGLASLILLSGCANHHCRARKDGADMKPPGTEATATGLILVAKPDGSKQCEEKSGLSLQEMAKDLGKIKIHRQMKINDGMMRIQVCGAPTGINNVYEIDAADQKKALDVGFEIWKGPKK